MKPAPFFSIIIPTFNRAHLLSRAIDSVLKQTYPDWELIVVDDGSTDNTAELVIQINDDRIRYVYQHNNERSSARNNGIEHGTGRYICFLDSDDYYFPNRLALLYAELERRNFPCQMLYTGLVMDNDGKIEQPQINEPATGANIFDHIATQVIHSQQVCICCTIMQEYKFDIRFRIAEDTELWLRIARKYKVIYLKDQYTVAVVHHDDRTVNLMRNNSGEGQLQIYKYIFTDAHSGKKISARAKQYMLADSYHAIARYYVYQNKRWQAAEYILKALNADKNSPWTKFRINVFLKLITFSDIEKVKALIDA